MKKTVLVVEDNHLNMKLFTQILSMAGYQTLQADQATIGLEMARSNRPHLILTDVRLPGMSGLDLSRIVKGDEELGGTPVIAVSAYEIDREDMIESRCDDFIPKPISVTSFLNTVQAYL